LPCDVHRYYQKECEPGYYCQSGLRRACKPGTFGSVYRASDPDCSGLCKPGYFCPIASSRENQMPCGAAHLICPIGSPTPTIVPAGYYSNEDSREELRSYMKVCDPGYYCPGDGRRYLCPNGTYAAEPGSTTPQCQGLCNHGYYCTEGSTSPTQFECGSANAYCVRGSGSPQQVSPGFYGVFTGPDAGAQALWNPRNTVCFISLTCSPQIWS
jgi:hypothetical protein